MCTFLAQKGLKNMLDIHLLNTEQTNADSKHFSSLSVAESVRLMNREDARVLEAIKAQEDQIVKVINMVTEALRQGGRLIYTGAGTSGRLGVLDAVECPPTFGVPDDMVIGLVAGGECSFSHPREDAEDSEEEGREDLRALSLTDKDVVIGVAASGRTPYVQGAIKYARSVGAATAAIVCSKNGPIEKLTESVVLDTGPEVLTGSTRLKAGTACKMVMNMISTISMKELGRVYKNYMVDVSVSNEKLKARAEGIVESVTGCDKKTAEKLLAEADNDVKCAIVMAAKGTSAEESKKLLVEAQGFLDRIL